MSTRGMPTPSVTPSATLPPVPSPLAPLGPAGDPAPTVAAGAEGVNVNVDVTWPDEVVVPGILFAWDPVVEAWIVVPWDEELVTSVVTDTTVVVIVC